MKGIAKMYSNTHKFIFIHWGKCAGSSIKQALASINGLEVKLQRGHADLDTMKRLIKEDGFNFEQYFKFSCVRNPWDRMVSLYHHMSTEGERHPNNPEKQKINFEGTFEEFLYHQELYPSIYPNFQDFDHVVRYEFLQDDFNILCEKLGIPNKVELPRIDYNTGRPKINYQLYYNLKTKELVTKQNLKIIELFGYKFRE